MSKWILLLHILVPADETQPARMVTQESVWLSYADCWQAEQVALRDSAVDRSECIGYRPGHRD